MNAHAQATQPAGKGVEWGEGAGAGCQLSCKPATWCQQLEKFRPNCQWEGKVRLARAKEEEEEEEEGIGIGEGAGTGKLKINNHDEPKKFIVTNQKLNFA